MEKFLFSQKKIFFYKLEKKYGKIGYNVGPYRKLYFFIIYRIEKILYVFSCDQREPKLPFPRLVGRGTP